MTTSTDPTDDALERRVAAFLRAEAPAVAPPGLLDGALRRLDATPAPAGRPRLGSLVRSPEWLGLGLMAAFVLFAVAGVMLLGGGSREGAGAGPGAGDAPDYEGIRFRASGLVIAAGGKAFTLDPATADASSDPGDATYRTLEWTWQQHGVEMRLNLYLASDGGRWWVSELRVRDGRARAEWLTVPGPLFERALGTAYDGPVELTAAGPTGPARLVVDRLVLLPTFASPPAAWTTGPVGAGDDGPVSAPDAFAPGQLLNCIGAEAMTPQQLALFARSRGYPVEYRYLSDGYSAKLEPPPGSVLVDAMWGSSGQLIVMAGAPGEPIADQVRLTAERACPDGGGSK
jgi:hypothetical protein